MIDIGPNLPHVKQNMISGINKLVIRVASRVAKQLKTVDLRKWGNVRKISNSGGDSLVHSLPPRNETLAIAVRKYAKVHIKYL